MPIIKFVPNDLKPVLREEAKYLVVLDTIF